jgi:hypothetical protein
MESATVLAVGVDTQTMRLTDGAVLKVDLATSAMGTRTVAD